MAGLPVNTATAPTEEEQYAALCLTILGALFPPGTTGRTPEFQLYGGAANSAEFYAYLCSRYGVRNIGAPQGPAVMPQGPAAAAGLPRASPAAGPPKASAGGPPGPR